MKELTETEKTAFKALRRLWIGYRYRYAWRMSIGSTWYERKIQEAKSASDFWKTFDLACKLPLSGQVVHVMVATIDTPFDRLEEEFLDQDGNRAYALADWRMR